MIKDWLLDFPSIRTWVTNKNNRKKYSFSSELVRLQQKFQDFTMCQEFKYLPNLKLVEKHDQIKGCVVECGTWKGGMIAGIAELLNQQNRTYYLFDSFEGLPDVTTRDGEKASDWQKENDHNCQADEDFANRAMEISGATSYFIHKGWFKDTLPHFDPKEPIAILRLDGDWYDSTMECLDHLYDKVANGGIIIIDDYFAWEGCAKAIHDFLSKRDSLTRVREYMDTVAYLIKQD